MGGRGEEKMHWTRVDSHNWQHHAELGADLLQRLEFFRAASDFVRLHHQPWSDEPGWNDAPGKVRISSNALVLAGMCVWPHVELRMDGLEQVGQIFSRIVDFRSPFTATHSIGVATTAEELARGEGVGGGGGRVVRL